MAEPRTEWGQEAVEDIRELKAGQADLRKDIDHLAHRLGGVEGKLDDLRAEIGAMGERFADRFDTMHAEFTEFRGLVKGVVEHDTELRHLAEAPTAEQGRE